MSSEARNNRSNIKMFGDQLQGLPFGATSYS